MDMIENSVTNKKITVIGPAIVDVLAFPVDVFNIQAGSQPMEDIKLSYGGDALNEAVILSRLGANVELISKVGQDQAGEQIFDFLKKEGVSCAQIRRDKNLRTSINVVLVDKDGERYFLTNPKGSMRNLTELDIEAFIDTAADIVSFTGMFVSPLLDVVKMERIFKRIKEKPGRILAVDMTKAKNGENLKDLEKLLKYVDFIFPNETEIEMLTGEEDVRLNAKYLIDAGVKCAVIKCGKKGCIIHTKSKSMKISAYPVSKVVDSTGAGDSFAAGFLYGLLQGFSIDECGILANAVASCTVENLGAIDGVQSIEEPLARYNKMIEKKESVIWHNHQRFF